VYLEPYCINPSNLDLNIYEVYINIVDVCIARDYLTFVLAVN
jgi:hypothetical protein